MNKIRIFTGKGLVIFIFIVFDGAFFRVCIVFSRLLFFKVILLTNMSRFLGRSRLFFLVMLLGIKERIIIIVFVGLIGF